MPKITATRKDKAAELLERLRRGPALSPAAGQSTLTVDDARRSVRGWLESWVTPLVTELVPELKAFRERSEFRSYSGRGFYRNHWLERVSGATGRRILISVETRDPDNPLDVVHEAGSFAEGLDWIDEHCNAEVSR